VPGQICFLALTILPQRMAKKRGSQSSISTALSVLRPRKSSASPENDHFIRSILSCAEDFDDESGAMPAKGGTDSPKGGQDKMKRVAKMAALPAIYQNAKSRPQGLGFNRRFGGGFAAAAGQGRDDVRFSSAPTGLVEFLSMHGNIVRSQAAQPHGSPQRQ
jgi:hypothetical protein